MEIKANQVYFIVEQVGYGKDYNKIVTTEFVSESKAKTYFKSRRNVYLNLSDSAKLHFYVRLAKVRCNQSITLSSCGYGILDNFSFEEEPI